MDPAKKGLSHALHIIGAALGLNVNCSCEDTMKPTDIITLAANLKGKGVDLSDLKVNFDLAELTKMDDAGRAAVYGALKALEKASAKAAEAPADDEAKKVAANAAAAAAATAAAQAAAQPITMGQLQTMITNAVTTAVSGLETKLQTNARRRDVVDRIVANEGNVIPRAELESMSIETLEKIDQATRPVDYSGAGAAGGYAANADDKPLGMGLGLFSIKSAN